jgi:hypothetical protein
MKKTSKKIMGSLMIATILAVIGVTVVSAQTENGMFWGGRGFMTELTDEQREELQATVQQKFEEYGIEMPSRDEMLDKKIEHTKQRLEILERQKELREEGYEWEDIQEIIQDEFELEFPEEGQHMRFGRGHCGYFRGFGSE